MHFKPIGMGILSVIPRPLSSKFHSEVYDNGVRKDDQAHIYVTNCTCHILYSYCMLFVCLLYFVLRIIVNCFVLSDHVIFHVLL